MTDVRRVARVDSELVRLAVAAAIENFEIANLDDEQTFQSAGLDSLDEVTILIELEDRYGLTVEECDAEKCNSISGIVDYFQTVADQSATAASA